MKLISLAVLALSANAFAMEPSVEWLSYNGSHQPVKVVITEEDVADNEYVLGYVRDLIGRSQLCYRGDAKQVLTKIVGRGIAWDQAESCDTLALDKNQRITVGPCSIDGVTQYSLSIGACR